MILDGEVAVTDAEGRPSFARLQQRAALSSPSEIARAMVANPVTYFAFDLLAFGALRPARRPAAHAQGVARAAGAAARAAAARAVVRRARRGRVRGDPRAAARGDGREAARFPVSLRAQPALEEAAPARERRLRDRGLHRRARRALRLRRTPPRLARERRAALFRPRRHRISRRGARSRCALRSTRWCVRRLLVSAPCRRRAATSGWSRAWSARSASPR